MALTEIDPGHRQIKLEATKKYHLWYVADVSVPKNAPNARDNQREASFNWWFQLLRFIWTNPHARAAVQANRFQVFTLGPDVRRAAR